MKNFSHLLVKEIKELLNKQLIISLAAMLLIFYFIGSVTRTEMKKAAAKQKIAVLDLDKSEISRNIIGALNMANFIIEEKAGPKEQVVEEIRNSDLDLLVVIPSGFGNTVSRFEAGQVETYSYLRGISISGGRKSEIVRAVLNATNEYLSNDFLKKRAPEINPELLKEPIKNREFVVVREKMAEGSAAAITGSLYAQSFILPIILMMIIIYSAQMVITAIAMEKQDKTLETLLTVPVSREAIVTAKMLAAGLVGLLSAVVYMYGFQNAFSFTNDEVSQAMSGVAPILKELGLTISTQGYLLFGLSLFLSILCALSLATILGVLAEDYRTAQSLSFPLIFLVMIPYFISLFADINTMALPAKILVLIIPFSHPFFAMQNLMFGHLTMLWLGIVYNLVFVLVMLYWAAKIFSTDRVLTMKLRWGKKKVIL
ncbi:MAG: ABC transporter permease [Acidobacteriota bacterium]|nr:ABC transporter permease [Acidobacteriota bacterium]MDW3228474.1 ABC transporter permease [Acidobacteriota bacterium]MDY0231572.1 ABC transporter permease [Candidatus Saccharicenans sp.]